MTSTDEALPVSDEDHTQFGQVVMKKIWFKKQKKLGHFYVWHLHKNILLTINEFTNKFKSYVLFLILLNKMSK